MFFLELLSRYNTQIRKQFWKVTAWSLKVCFHAGSHTDLFDVTRTFAEFHLMRRNLAFLNEKLDRWRSKTTTKMVSRSRRRASHQTDSSIAPMLDVAQRGLLVDCPRSGRPKMSGPRWPHIHSCIVGHGFSLHRPQFPIEPLMMCRIPQQSGITAGILHDAWLFCHRWAV